MLYEDRMAVATPEGVTLEFTLAGVGSRFVAGLLDVLLMGGMLLAVGLLAWGFQGALGDYAAAAGTLAAFVVIACYDITWETLASGRTPGKRWTGLRVVKLGGAPVTFLTSAVRNLLRLVDFLPGFYLVGMVTVLATPKNQRLGDLAAGTIVVRERVVAPGGTAGPWVGWSSTSGGAGASAASAAAAADWDVSAVTAEEVAAVRQFLARRDALPLVARNRLAMDMAGRLRPKVVGPGESVSPEGFLEGLVAAKSDRA
jgi:uncharacterized RDD family membrane protein YckC